MRKAFVDAFIGLAKENTDLFLLTADLGYSVFEPVIEKIPQRVFNIGVAEQNTIGIAAGLALTGKTVFVYSIIPFATMRCLEQIRNDICMQNLNVKIVGMGAGLHYGPSGPTHHAIEDIGILRSLPNMTIISPGFQKETQEAVKSAFAHKGPVYIRLSKCSAQEDLYKGAFRIGKASLLKDGKDATIIAAGSILSSAFKAADILNKKGISMRIINMHTIKPIDKDIILRAAKETRAIFTIEEHNLIGGLGSAVSEVLAESDIKIAFERIALPDSFIRDVGDREHLLEKYGLSGEDIANKIIKRIE